MCAGVRAIEYIQDHDLLAHAREMGANIRDRFREIEDKTPEVGEIGGEGLFIGVEFVDEDGEPNKPLVKAIQQYCYEHGIMVWTAGRNGNVLRIIPPLVITDKQVEIGMDIVIDGVETHT